MKRYLNTIVLLVIIVFSFTSLKCKKNKSITGGGKGGNATLVLRAEHGNVLIALNSGKAYIKYGTQNPPENGIYDDSANFQIDSSSSNPMLDTISQAIFPGLTNGVYYIQAYGVHSTYPQPNIESVAPVTISSLILI
jgi:hypothetical protein